MQVRWGTLGIAAVAHVADHLAGNDWLLIFRFRSVGEHTATLPIISAGIVVIYVVIIVSIAILVLQGNRVSPGWFGERHVTDAAINSRD